MRVTMGPVIFTVALEVAERPPFEAVMVAVPFPTDLTNPVALTVATAVFEEPYVVPALDVMSWVEPSEKLAVSVNCCVLPLVEKLRVAGDSDTLVTMGPVEMLPVTKASSNWICWLETSSATAPVRFVVSVALNVNTPSQKT